MIVELVATQLSDVVTIEQAGAAGVILTSSMADGGITPSIGFIVRAVNSVNINVNVALRPHTGGYCYSDYDLGVIEDDICAITETNASAVILGLLDENGNINIKQLESLLPKVKNKGIIFCNAIDEADDIVESARIISRYEEIKGIYTKGGKGDFLKRMDNIKRMTEAAPELYISVGGGIGIHNLADVNLYSGANAFHAASSVRKDSAGVDLYLAKEFIAFTEMLAYDRMNDEA